MQNRSSFHLAKPVVPSRGTVTLRDLLTAPTASPSNPAKPDCSFCQYPWYHRYRFWCSLAGQMDPKTSLWSSAP